MSAKRTRFTLDLDPLFQKRLKVMATLKGMTMRQYCLVAIEKELAEDEAKGAGPLPFGEKALDRLNSLMGEVFQGRKIPGDS
ncbi:MAG: hypothetical protein HYV08_16390, partial [Deltaproteobacteria bacterium]|nr:hypothetical protein [Deltaproteobacteria bacterium]